MLDARHWDSTRSAGIAAAVVIDGAKSLNAFVMQCAERGHTAAPKAGKARQEQARAIHPA